MSGRLASTINTLNKMSFRVKTKPSHGKSIRKIDGYALRARHDNGKTFIVFITAISGLAFDSWLFRFVRTRLEFMRDVSADEHPLPVCPIIIRLPLPEIHPDPYSRVLDDPEGQTD